MSRLLSLEPSTGHLTGAPRPVRIKRVSIGVSVRRECVDHVVVFGERHLRRVRTHLPLNKDAPSPRAVQATGHIISFPILAGSITNIAGYDLR
jgi:hypothetical protein